MAVRLFIAEKPNVAKAIASVLNGGSLPSKNAQGTFQVGDDIVANCAGHILENAMPEDYDEKFKQWKIEDLPIVPEVWKLRVPKDPGKQRMLAQIKSGLDVADEVYHCGDPDSQGQLLVDEVIDFFNWNGPVKRVLISDLNPGPIEKALNSIRDNKEFALLSLRALTRSRADWLLGINLSRFYTKLAESVGIREKLAAGRVQSAVLGLVSKRDLEIKNFKPHPYFKVSLRVDHPNGSFLAAWKPRKNQEGLDEEGRLVCSEVLSKLEGILPQAARITHAETARKLQKPLKPYSLSELQKDASKKLGIDMQATLDIAQDLYDKFQLTTYPRTDCPYLPEDQLRAAPSTLAAVGKNLVDLRGFINEVNLQQKPAVFDDKKVGAHHAIIPTEKVSPDSIAQMSANQRAVYDLICKRFVIQFLPDAQFDATEIKVGLPDEDGEVFIAHGKVWIEQGWRKLIYGANGSSNEELEEEEGSDNQTLPKTKSGDTVEAQGLTSETKKTRPPAHYNDATLITAMMKIDTHVTNPEVKKMLREGDGIGTEATRASIVTKLIEEHHHLRRKEKSIRATNTGLLHYRLMPNELKTPDMAGVFESALHKVEAGNLPLEAFLNQMKSFVVSQLTQEQQLKWIEQAKKIAPQAQPSEFKCRNCNESLFERKTVSNKKNLLYFQCLSTACGCSFRSDNGVPTSCFKGPLKESDDAKAKQKLDEMLASAPKCEECGNPLRRYRKKKKRSEFLWVCHEYQDKPSCDSFYSDEDGKVGQIFKRRGEMIQREADGPICPVCQEHHTFSARNKETKQSLLICKGCDSMMESDENLEIGKIIRTRGEWAPQPLEGPACPVCHAEKTKKVLSKKKQPLWICDACDSMGFRLKSGQPNKPFKIKGKKVPNST